MFSRCLYQKCFLHQKCFLLNSTPILVRYLDPEREMKNPESFSLRLFDALSPMIAVRPSARA